MPEDWQNKIDGSDGRARRRLAAILRGELPAAPLGIEEAQQLVTAARKHGLLGQLNPEWIAALPPSVAKISARLLAEAKLAQRQVQRAWEETATVLEDSGIHALTLKGPPLAERLYGTENLRFSTDVDFLVLGEDLERAEARLVASGGRRAGRYLLHSSGISVELHGGQSPDYGTRLDTDIAVSRSIPWRSARGFKTWILDPTDELLHLLCHFAKHRCMRLSWAEDVRRHRRVAASIDTESLQQRATEAGLSGLLLLGARAIHRELGSDSGLERLADGRPGPRLLAAEILLHPTFRNLWPWTRYPGLLWVPYRALLRDSLRESSSEIAAYLVYLVRRVILRMLGRIHREE